MRFERFDRQEFLRRVCETVRQSEFDVVQVYNRPSWVLPLRQAAPNAVTLLSLHNLTHNMVNQHLAVRGFQEADCVLTISDFVAADAVEKVPRLSEKVQTVYTGVDLREYSPRWSDRGVEWRTTIRSLHNLPPDNPVVLFVGRLIETKGCDILLRAMSEVLATHEEAKLLIVGSTWYADDSISEYVKELQRLAEACGRSVVFTSYVDVDEIPKYYAAADVFVCASQWNEPLGRVHYEAMAAGLPIVTTRRGGIGEVVQNGENGIVIDRYQDPAAFATAIVALLDDPVRADAMGRAGRKKAEEVYNFERMSSELQAIYSSLVQRNERNTGMRPEGPYSGVDGVDDGKRPPVSARMGLTSRSRLFARRVRRKVRKLIQN